MLLIEEIPQSIIDSTTKLINKMGHNVSSTVEETTLYTNDVSDFLDLLSLRFRFYKEAFKEKETDVALGIMHNINTVMNTCAPDFVNSKYTKEFLEKIQWKENIEETINKTCQIGPYDEKHVEFMCGDRSTVDFSMRGDDIYKIVSAVLDAQDGDHITTFPERGVCILPTKMYNNNMLECVISPHSVFKIVYRDAGDKFLGEDTAERVWEVMQVCYSGVDAGHIVEMDDAVIMSKDIYQRMADIFDFLHLKVAKSDAIWPLEFDNTTYLISTADFMQKEQEMGRALLDKFLNIYRQILDLNEDVDKYMKGDRPK